MLKDFDYDKHNEGVRALAEAERLGRGARVRMELSTNPRIILMDPALNTNRVSFREYMHSPEIMARVQLEHTRYRDYMLCRDQIMGDDAPPPVLYADFQNLTEPCWFGCQAYYPENGEPCARHFLTDDNKYAYIERGMIAPVSGLIARAQEFLEYFMSLERAGYTYAGKRVMSARELPGMGTDGPMTICCGLRGATDMCLDMYQDAQFAQALLDYVTDNTINRVKALRRLAGQPEKSPSLYFADDSIALISTSDYEKFVLPCHKRLVRELSTGEQPNNMHLCGDASRHFELIARELNVASFDTGYPIDHGAIVRALGARVTIHGGVRADILRSGSRADVIRETRRILESVLPNRNFVIKEANNLAPRTPPENIRAMYETVCKYGVY